jgi:hypothetical protein
MEERMKMVLGLYLKAALLRRIGSSRIGEMKEC